MEDSGAWSPDHERTTVRSLCIDVEDHGELVRKGHLRRRCPVGTGTGMTESTVRDPDLSGPVGPAV